MILLADDNANDVELTLRVLGRYHLVNAVTVVNDGAAARDYLYRRQTFASRRVLINESPSTAAQRSGAPATPEWTFTPAFGGSDE